MEDLISKLTPSSLIIVSITIIILFVLNQINMTKMDVEWVAWRGVAQVARTVKHCGVPYEDLMAEINAVQERFNSRDRGNSLLELLAMKRIS